MMQKRNLIANKADIVDLRNNVYVPWQREREKSLRDTLLW